MKRFVYIVGGERGQYARMFKEHDWELTDTMAEADLVLFTGGADVSPQLYGEQMHHRTYYDAGRDAFEGGIYKQAQEMGIACAGICRGGQFLNVKNGGKMYQDVDNHGIAGTHPAFIVGNLIPVHVTSTHHQMMRPGDDGIVLMTAGLSKRKEYKPGNVISTVHIKEPEKLLDDVEVVYYPETNSLCFQPHPEYYDHEGTIVFFNFLEEYSFSEKLIDKMETYDVDGTIVVM